MKKRAQHAAEIVPRIRAALAGAYRARMGGAVRRARSLRGGARGRGHVRPSPGGVRGHPRELRASARRALPRHGAPDPLRRRTRARSVRRAGAGAALARDPGAGSATPDEEIERLHRTGAVVGARRRAREPERDGLSSCAASCSCPPRAPSSSRKALASEADAISFDLEDAVQETPKGRGARDAASVPAGDAPSAPRQGHHRAGERIDDRRTSRRTWPPWPGRAWT